MTLIEKLSVIQQSMKAPKNQYNSFGKYKYRSAEGILEAFKPYEGEQRVMLIVSDSIIAEGGRIYVKATATLMDCESDAKIEVSAFAREPQDKKGMDESQITGTASSYARKYALNGLFLLDDTKDPDTDEYHQQSSKARSEDQPRRTVSKLATTGQIKEVQREIDRIGWNIPEFMAWAKIQKMEQLTEKSYTDAMEKLKKKPSKPPEQNAPDEELPFR